MNGMPVTVPEAAEVAEVELCPVTPLASREMVEPVVSTAVAVAAEDSRRQHLAPEELVPKALLL